MGANAGLASLIPAWLNRLFELNALSLALGDEVPA